MRTHQRLRGPRFPEAAGRTPLRAAAACAAAVLAVAALSCRSPVSVSGRSSALTIAVAVPAVSAASYDRALKAAFAAPERFVHPGTFSASAELSAADSSWTISTSSAVDGRTGAATLVLDRVPSGKGLSLVVSLYGSDGSLLARGMRSVDLEGGDESVAISPTPVAQRGLVPGPVGAENVRGEACGAVVAAAETGGALVLAAELPAKGRYRIALTQGASRVAGFALYASGGIPVGGVADAPASAGYGRFEAPAPGTYYLLLQPAQSSSDLACSIDADLEASYKGPVAEVEGAGTFSDRNAPLEFSVACGASRVNAAPSVDGDGSALAGEAEADGSILVTGPRAARTGAAAITLEFTDALLGFDRSVSGIPIPAPRSFVYVSAAGSDAADGSRSAPVRTLAAAAALVPADGVPAVVALAADAACAEADAVSLARPALIAGGFEPDWSRRPDAAPTTVVLRPAAAPGYSLRLQPAAAGSVMDGVDLVCPAASYASFSAYSAVSVAAPDTLLRRCSIRAEGATGAGSFTILDVAAAVSVDLLRSTVAGGAFVPRSAVPSVVYGVYSNYASTITAMNSVVHPGSLAPVSAGVAAGIRGIQLDQAAAEIRLVGSTVSSGFLETAKDKPYTNVAGLACAGRVRTYNSLLIVDNAWRGGGPYAAYALRYNRSAGNSGSENGIVYQPDSAIGYLLYDSASGGTVDWETYASDFANSRAGSSIASAMAFRDFGRSTAAADADFRLSAASPDWAKTGGNCLADWAAGALGFALSAEQQAELGMDRDGKARTGSAGAGYSLGAYEF